MPRDELIRPAGSDYRKRSGAPSIKVSSGPFMRVSFRSSGQYRNRWPSPVSGIRRRSSKCVIAHKSESDRRARCIFMRPQRREIKFTHFIGPIKHAHISVRRNAENAMSRAAAAATAGSRKGTRVWKRFRPTRDLLRRPRILIGLPSLRHPRAWALRGRIH